MHRSDGCAICRFEDWLFRDLGNVAAFVAGTMIALVVLTSCLFALCVGAGSQLGL